MRSAILMVLWILASEAAGQTEIQRVETGLVPMTSPSLPAQFDTSGSETRTLGERKTYYGVPALSIAVIHGAGVAWRREYGERVAGSADPVTASTRFEAASTTKLLSSIVALHHVQSGAIDLDADVNESLVSWKIPDSEFTETEKVTLRRLLTHQSGLNRPEGGFDQEAGGSPSLVQILRGEKPARNPAAKVEAIPGERHAYSNFGYLVIQLLLEDVTGRSFSDLAEEAVFQPLGMSHSTLRHPLSAELRAVSAWPHDADGAVHERGQSATALAQGGLVTTAEDLALLAVELMRAWRGESQRVLSQSMVRQMLTPTVPIDPNEYFGMTSMGLGTFLMGETSPRYFLYPGFNDPGATSLLIGCPETGDGAVVLSNGAAGLQLSLEILASIIRCYDWAPPGSASSEDSEVGG